MTRQRSGGSSLAVATMGVAIAAAHTLRVVSHIVEG
jgi:hypothetical protein